MEYKIGGKTAVIANNNLFVADENKIIIFDIKENVFWMKDEIKIETIAHMTVSGDNRYIAMVSIFGSLYIYDFHKEQFIVKEKIMDAEGKTHFIEKNSKVLIVGLNNYFYVYDIERKALHKPTKSPALCSSVVNLNDDFYMIGLNKKNADGEIYKIAFSPRIMFQKLTSIEQYNIESFTVASSEKEIIMFGNYRLSNNDNLSPFSTMLTYSNNGGIEAKVINEMKKNYTDLITVNVSKDSRYCIQVFFNGIFLFDLQTKELIGKKNGKHILEAILDDNDRIIVVTDEKIIVENLNKFFLQKSVNTKKQKSVNLEAYLYDKVLSVINNWSEDGIYAISFLVYTNEAFEYAGYHNLPEFSVGYNTEGNCENVSLYSEERWNVAYWSQNMTEIIVPDEDNEGIKVLLDWYKEINVKNIGYEDINNAYDENMKYTGNGPSGYYELLCTVSSVARKLQSEGIIAKKFGKIPIIVHDLEYSWYIEEATFAANPNGEADAFLKAYKNEFE